MTLRRLSICLCAPLVACSEPPEGPAAIRLVDLFADAVVDGTPAAAEPAESAAWRFDGEAGTEGWQAGSGVADLEVANGRLTGRSTDDFPIVHVERASGIEDDDLLHAAEVTLRVSAGTEVSMSFTGDEKPILPAIIGRARTFPWTARATVEPGEETRTYTLRSSFDISAADTRHVLLRPTDAEGAEFEIESVRLIFRKEHLASSPAGVGWHGMSSAFRETITTRAPEVASFSLALPERPWLDLALATIDDAPVTFRVSVDGGDGERPGLDSIVFERTVSTPHRWEPAAVDLAEFAGREVTLTLAASADGAGTPALWGAPVVRNRLGDATNGRPQGVVVIVGDTLRSDHLASWGYSRVTAPVLAGLASDGVRAADCISQATWTKVSVPSIFTSRYPLSHTVHQMTDRLPASAVTMAEVFRDAGYATLGLSSIPFTGRMTNLHQGYEEFHESSSLPRDRNAKTARTYLDRLAGWLDRHRDVPFFVFLHVADPHSPYEPYAPYTDMWGQPGDNEEYVRQQDAVREHIQNPLMKRFGMPTRAALEAAELDPERYVEYELNAYDASILAMDLEIGRLIERLQEIGVYDRTLIAFTSDHGTEFLDHDEHFHGHTVYGELNRVPMLLAGPGVPAGVVVPQTIQSIDLMPTVLEVAGLDPPEGMQGQSLVPWFSATGAEDAADGRRRAHPAFTEKAYSGDDDVRGVEEAYSIVLDGWKLIHNARRPETWPEYELYDHRADPINTNNLAAEHPERVEQLAAQLAAWRESAAAEQLASDEALTEGMSEEDLERLRSLGYVQ
ncbi:MAG: sulfatase-like hydrolase/transferase [bacterium]|nr:sulfatase-like hydrolase/transferase [bacterium]